MDLKIKKRKKPRTCDVERCKQRIDLTVVKYGGEKVKICSKHRLQLFDDGAPAPTIEAKGETVSVTPAAPSTPAAVSVNQAATLALVEPVRAEAETQLEQLVGIQITTQGALDAAGALLQDVKGKAKAIEKQRTSVTKPLNDAKKQIDAWFKPAKEALEKLETFLKDGIAGYVTAQEQARLAALQAGEHEAALATEQPTMPSGIQTRTLWKWRIVNETLIPREYLVVDAAKIQQHVNIHKSQSTIPGIEVYPDTGVAASARSQDDSE